MADKNFVSKLANVPLAKPGFDDLGMAAPVLVQMNPQGKWENCHSKNLEEEQLKSIIQYLVKTNAFSTARSYCSRCMVENKASSGNQSYVPVVMLPISSADECPFDLECEIKKIKESNKTTTQKVKKKEEIEHEDEKDKKKIKKRGFVLQRLTDFDLLSQW